MIKTIPEQMEELTAQAKLKHLELSQIADRFVALHGYVVGTEEAEVLRRVIVDDKDHGEAIQAVMRLRASCF